MMLSFGIYKKNRGIKYETHTKQQTAFDTIIECINSNTPVLLTGFAGTGKNKPSQRLSSRYLTK